MQRAILVKNSTTFLRKFLCHTKSGEYSGSHKHVTTDQIATYNSPSKTPVYENLDPIFSTWRKIRLAGDLNSKRARSNSRLTLMAHSDRYGYTVLKVSKSRVDVLNVLAQNINQILEFNSKGALSWDHDAVIVLTVAGNKRHELTMARSEGGSRIH